MTSSGIDTHTPMIIATEIKSNYINNSEIDTHTPMIIATEIKCNYINNYERTYKYTYTTMRNGTIYIY